MKSADTIEKMAVGKRMERNWTLKQLRHWQRRIWKAKEREAGRG